MPTGVDRPWPDLPPVSKSPYARLKERLSFSAAGRVRKIARLFLLVLVAVILAVGVVLYVTRTYSFDTATYPSSVHGVVVDADIGEIDAVGTDRPDALLIWQRRYSLIRPTIQRGVSGDMLHVRSHCPPVSFRCAVILGFQVSNRTALSIHSNSAPVGVQSLSAPVDITTQSGETAVQHVAAPVDVRSSNGNVSLDDIRGDIVAKTGSAPIELHDIHGRIHLATDSGTVTGTNWDTPALEAQTNTGWITTDFSTPPTQVDIRSSSGQITLYLPAGRYRLELDAPVGKVHVRGIVNDPTAKRVVRIHTGGGIILNAR